MALNKTETDRREQRRQKVAQILVRRPRVTVRQIRRALAKSGHTNPKTGEPWSIGTVQSDIEVVREEAREQMRENADEWRAKELDKLRQLEQDAWGEGNHKLVLRCMKRRADLLGLDEPDQIEHEGELGLESNTLDEVMKSLTDRAARLGAEEKTDD
jgi:hypothetical protein